MKTILIGRNKNECDISFPEDNLMSRIHAELNIYDDGKLEICDRNSLNHTYIYYGGGQNCSDIIQRQIVSLGDDLLLGQTRISVKSILDTYDNQINIKASKQAPLPTPAPPPIPSSRLNANLEAPLPGQKPVRKKPVRNSRGIIEKR